MRVRGGYLQLAQEGMPDIGAVVSGVPVLFETKTRDGKLSAHQTLLHEHLRRAGARVEVTRSVAEAVAVVRQILEARK